MPDPKQDSKRVSFTLNGKAVFAEPGETVLSVAKRHGVRIPTLCHHDAVTPYGACRLCVVEAIWGKRSKLVTSCIYTPYENDIIKTDTERVRHTRRIVLELLLARCPQVKLLQDLGREYGLESPRFRVEGAPGDERCILCGLCVRVCDEVVRAHAIGYAGRGFERVISTPFGEQADECIGCGACVFVCPTEALHYEDLDGHRRMRELNTEVPLVACLVCGRPFATGRQIAKVRERLALPEGMAETCPTCRAAGFQEIMSQSLALAKNARRDTTSPAWSATPGLPRTPALGKQPGREEVS